eukprot:Opistho-2@5950
MATNPASDPPSDEEEFHDANAYDGIEEPSSSKEDIGDEDEGFDPALAARAAESVRTGVDGEGLPVGLGMTANEIRKGFGLFFENKQPEAEKFFEQYKESVPVFALGFASLQVMRAVMTFEQPDMERAMRCLKE